MGRSRRTLDWYVADVEERGEVRPPRLVRVWSPVRRLVELVDGEWMDRSEEMFPGYILCASCFGLPFMATNLQVRFVSRTPLPGEDVERLRESERVSVITGPAGFGGGEACIVSESARSSYAGMPCVFESVAPVEGGFFARVLVDVYGEKVSAWVPFDHLEKA